MISSSLFSINKIDNTEIRIKKINLILHSIPLLCAILIYIFTLSLYSFRRKNIDTFILEKELTNEKIPPIIYFFAGLEELDKYNRENFLKYMDKYTLNIKEDTILSQNVKDTINIALNKKDSKDKYFISPPPYFNIAILQLLKYIEQKNYDKAKKMIDENWDEISNSYVRNPDLNFEKRLDIDLTKTIKDISFRDLLIVSPDIKKHSEICNKLNEILLIKNKEKVENCNFGKFINKSKYISVYINEKCLSPNITDDTIIKNILEYEKNGKFDEAIKIIEKEIKINPSYKLYLEMGNIYTITNQLLKAIPCYEKSIELYPCGFDAYPGLIYCYIKTNNEMELNKLVKKAREYNFILDGKDIDYFIDKAKIN